MMNLTMSHSVPNYGDSFTITCYVCGMPSSKEWAQKARSRPTTPQKPYYPFLLQITPVGGAILREDGSTYLCAFCHGSLEAQWNVYETQQVVPPPNRKYNIQKFICAVCGVETYRKRIRALPFQEFPFLEKTRQAGSITLGNNPLAVVCLDCSETLWAQSAEYDRWGLPVQKRHFNWMARPPPPEDSVEATVARLPSGETQLPRCPPIEPCLGPKPDAMSGVKILDTAIAAKARSKGKGDSPKLENSHNLSSSIPPTNRKVSLTSTTPPALDMVGGFHNQQPPVVTVAPMSSHTTVISLRKDSVGMPPGMITTASGSIYPPPSSAVYPPAAQYAPYVWGPAPRETSSTRVIEAYPYGSSAAPETMHGPPGTWPWLPHPPADLIRYQSYVSSLQSRSIGESTRSPTHSAGSSSVVYGASGSPPRYSSSINVAVSSRTHDRESRERSPLDDQRPSTLTSSRRGASGGSSDDLTSTYPRKNSPETRPGMKSPKATAVTRDAEKPSSSARPYPMHHKKLPKDPETTTVSKEVPITVESSSVLTRSPPPPTIMEEEEQEKSNRREFHIPKKRNWHVFMKDSQSLAQPQEKKVDEMPSHPKKKKSSLSMSESEVSVSNDPGAAASRDDSSVKYATTKGADSSSGASAESAMDLSASSSTKSCKSGGGKFMIEYLCKSESTKLGESTSQVDDAAPRTSVIKCAPKVPSVSLEDASQNEEAQEISKKGEARSPAKEGRGKKEPSPAKDAAAKVDEATRKKNIGGEDEGEKRVEATKVGDDDKIGGTKGKEDSKDEKKGNSERAQQDSTMNSDDVDDETKNEDLPNLEQFIKETVLELIKREKDLERIKKEETHQQKQFLNELGLVTPDKKIELEIKSIVSRHDRKTLPPLKLRVDTKIGRKIDKKLKELLLKVSLEDPSLFQEKPESDKCEFMAELGMKTAKKSEKTKREIKWRVVLMERMRRELRDSTARGVKHEWEKAEILKRFADCDLDSFFSSLSFASLLSPDEELDREDATGSEKDKDNSSEENGGKRVCINYPKYIPSYAVAGSDTDTPVKMEEESANTTEDVSSGAGGEPNLAEPILKIPVIPPKRRLQSESSSVTTVASDTDDSSDMSILEEKKVAGPVPSTSTGGFSFGASTEPYPLRIDNLIQCSASYWEQMKRGIDDILNDLESSKEDVPTEEKTIQIEKICKHLKSQLSDIKNIEKKLRATGKTILNASRRKNQRKSE